MKKFLFLILLIVPALAQAQYISNVNPEVVLADPAIAKLKQSLPAGWELTFDSTAMYVVRKEEVYVPKDRLKNLTDCPSCMKGIDQKVINFNGDKRWCYKVKVFYKFALGEHMEAFQARQIHSRHQRPASKTADQEMRAKYNADAIEKMYDLDARMMWAPGMSKGDIKKRRDYIANKYEWGLKPYADYISSNFTLYLVRVQGEPADEKTDPPGVNAECAAIRMLIDNVFEKVH